MKIKLNQDNEVVKTVREGLIAKDGYCPCRVGKKPNLSVCAKSFALKLPTLTLKDCAIVNFFIKKNKTCERVK